MNATESKYGRLTVQSTFRNGGHAYCNCRCDCGIEKAVRLVHLSSGAVISCGCAHRIEDLAGRRFGQLVATCQRPVGYGKGVVWLCRCDCGGAKDVSASRLIKGYTKSCGCLLETHGMSNRREYGIWKGIIERCCNSNNPAFSRYGGRGITICEKWRSSFVAFFDDVGPAPSKDHSIDRYPDNDGNYEPGNVRWATRREQALNTRRTLLATINEETRPLAEWCDIYGMDYSTVLQRVKKLGWAVEDALAKPVRPLRASQ